MATDTILAILHHILIFMLFAMLVAELMLVRPGLSRDSLKRLGGIDGAYGGLAAAVLLIGILRVVWGAKGWDYYSTNPWFWIKFSTFIVVGVLSVPPTLKYIAWRKAIGVDSAYVIAPSEIAAARRLIHAQLGLFILIPVFAALMARY